MNKLTLPLLRRLADGDFHSGEKMARHLGASRASVCNALCGLDALGIDIYRIRGRGYRLPQPLSLLDCDSIVRALVTHAGRFRLEVLDTASSTNTLLLERSGRGAVGGSVIAAEWQTGGRGRFGRIWHSAPGATLTFSLLWRFQQGASFLAGLSLAVGVAVARALTVMGARDVRLKWPNDIVWRGRKLAGILIEMQGDTLGPSAAVIGIGLNCRLPPVMRTRIDQPAADMEAACGAPVDRNRVLAALLVELMRVLDDYARHGFVPLRLEWQQRHLFQDKTVRFALPDGSSVRGIARGVGDDGGLLIATASGERRFHSGEITTGARGAR